MIRDVFLDVDDTILDFGRAEREALASALSQMGVGVTDARIQKYHEVNLAHWQMLERGEITRERLLVRRFEKFFESVGVFANAEKTQHVYEYELGRRSYFLEGAEALLETLRTEGYRIFLASNGTTVVQTNRIASAGIARYFEGIFLSQELGADKPQIEFFERATNGILGYTPEESIILGDSLTSDIQGGINAGMHTCWFNPHRRERENVTPEFEIADLAEFDTVLQKLNQN